MLLYPSFQSSPDSTPLQPLLVAATANGEGTAQIITKARDYNIYCYGVFDGATVTFKWRVDDSVGFVNFKDAAAANVTITQPRIQYVLLLSAGIEIVAEIASAGASTSINAFLG